MKETFKEKIYKELLQLKLLLKKNFIVAARSWISTCIELLSPVFFILILLIIAKTPIPQKDNHDKFLYNSSIPNCIPWAEDRCFTLMFSPSTSPIAVELMNILTEYNDPKIPPVLINPDLNQTQVRGGIIGVPNKQDIFDFVQNHPNITLGGIDFVSFPQNFTTPGMPNDPLQVPNANVFFYNLLMNVSCPNVMATCVKYQVPITSALQRAINIYVSRLKGEAKVVPQITVTTSVFPIYQPSSNAVSTYGCLFFYCGSTISFIFLMYKIAYEKENKLKQGLVTMGLGQSVYSVSWFITSAILNLLITLITIAIGAACQFDYFKSTNFFVNFFLFFLFTMAMSQVAFFVLSFLSTTKAAIGLGMVIFIVGAILQLILSQMGPLIFQTIYEKDNTAATVARVFLFFIPMFHFSKAITDINTISSLYQFTKIGFKWSDLSRNLNSKDSDYAIPQTGQSLLFLFILSIIYIVLAWYFDNVIPGNDGNSQPPWFFLLPSYWGIVKKKPKYIAQPIIHDQDVKNAIDNAHDVTNKSPLIILGLSKTYNKFLFVKNKIPAVRYLSLSVENSNVLCLLGSNGAGKSTTIGLLTGLTNPSSGDAIIYGKSIVSDIDSVRKMTSVCPQHDILWNELTAQEHLELFAELKGVPPNQRITNINHALDSVKLKKVANNQVSTYSGGMKRRLSVAIASCIGDPRIVFLDEPTTGMDPQSRRHIWNLIKDIKKDRVIILTTHLMEEADILGDKIVIMSKGVMACVGNSLQLKTRFGEGYSVNIIARSSDRVDEIKYFVSQQLPNSKLLTENADFLKFGFPLTTESSIIVEFFRSLENISQDPNAPIRDWGVSHSRLGLVSWSFRKHVTRLNIKFNSVNEYSQYNGLQELVSSNLSHFKSKCSSYQNIRSLRFNTKHLNSIQESDSELLNQLFSEEIEDLQVIVEEFEENNQNIYNALPVETLRSLTMVIYEGSPLDLLLKQSILPEIVRLTNLETLVIGDHHNSYRVISFSAFSAGADPFNPSAIPWDGRYEKMDELYMEFYNYLVEKQQKPIKLNTLQFTQGENYFMDSKSKLAEFLFESNSCKVPNLLININRLLPIGNSNIENLSLRCPIQENNDIDRFVSSIPSTIKSIELRTWFKSLMKTSITNSVLISLPGEKSN
eukprot:gene3971-4967_t